MRYWLLTFTLLLFFSACQESPDSIESDTETISEQPVQEATPELIEIEVSEDSISIEEVAGIYVGDLPCADCERMDYRIELAPDGGYTERIYYIGKSKEPHETVGKFVITEDNKIDLGKYIPGMNFLAKTEMGLLMLDIDGNVITGPLAQRFVLTPFVEEELAPYDESINIRMWNDGIEFYAADAETGWSLTLDLEKEIAFQTKGEKAIIVPPAEPELAEDADVIRFRTFNDNVELILTITSDILCDDGVSDQAYDASVQVEIKSTSDNTSETYTGCGRYSIHPELFETTWKLISLNDMAAEDSRYQRGAPQIAFRYFDRNFYGHDGCNEAGGRFSVRGDKISFSAFASTAMSCPDMTASREYNIAVQGETFSYVIYDELLTLSRFKSRMVFTKVQE